MASRTSTKITSGKGALIYQNSSSTAQLVALHAASNSSSVNVPITVVLDTSASRPLNTEKFKWGTVGGNVVDIDTRHSGADTISNVQSNGGVLGTSSTPFNASNTGNASKLYFNYDPYMRVKPSEYGNPSDDVCDTVFLHQSTARYLTNTLSMAAGDWTSLVGTTNNSYYGNHQLSYYSAGVVFDHYTNTFHSIHSNSYTEFGIYCKGNDSWQTGTRTSDSQIYQAMGGSYDPTSYPTHGGFSASFKSPMLQADGGVFVTYLNPPSSSYDQLVITPAGRGVFNGTLPTDKTSVTTSSLVGSGNTQIDGGWNYKSVFAVSDNSFQWFKYNKNNDTYYFAFGGSSPGIWQMKYENMTYSSNSYGGQGGGPQGGAYESFSGGSWVKKGDMPVNEMSIPARVGQSLWISYDLNSGDALFSTNLYDWSTKAAYFAANGIDATYSAVFQDSAQTQYLLTSSGNVIQVTSGMENIPADGLLEKESSIGNYERSGLILNPGDCLYAGNGSQTAAVSFTVTEVAI
tara:strand:+ start:1799 stop:3346 length:1548 start_codon:yes stop_codon:yes gene_type:complete